MYCTNQSRVESQAVRDLSNVAESGDHLLEVVHCLLTSAETGVTGEGGRQETLVHKWLEPHDHWVVYC